MVLSGEPAALVNADVDKMHVHNHDVGVRGTEVAHLRVSFIGLWKFANVMVVVAEVIVPHLREGIVRK